MFGLSSKSETDAPDTSPNPSPQVSFKVEKNGLYMLLWNTGVSNKYHWSLFVALDQESGIVFHQTLLGLKWKYTAEPRNVSNSRSLLVALKLGVVEGVDDQWMAAIKDIIRQTEVTGEFTCRTWALAALYNLADGGFIGLLPQWDDIQKIEQEAKDIAQYCYYGRVKVVRKSDFSKA
ncbi:hypothetical protein LOZ58_002747 [Ophidiomyces ophidiicola]|nr:hypothetical protein LOZ58_002747 [Ophidiomyces ophidiicola]